MLVCIMVLVPRMPVPVKVLSSRNSWEEPMQVQLFVNCAQVFVQGLELRKPVNMSPCDPDMPSVQHSPFPGGYCGRLVRVFHGEGGAGHSVDCVSSRVGFGLRNLEYSDPLVAHFIPDFLVRINPSGPDLKPEP